ncbi:MAG: hypothetical protein LOD90_00515 [Symbiobacteriaceae bacterium]
MARGVSVADLLRDIVEERVQQAGQAALQAVVDVGLMIWGESNKTAPKKTGDLRANAYLKFDGEELARGENPPASLAAPTGFRGRHVVEVGYGVEYAIYVHEMPPYQNPTTPGTRPKFLELAVQENRDRIARHVEQKVREALNDAG